MENPKPEDLKKLVGKIVKIKVKDHVNFWDLLDDEYLEILDLEKAPIAIFETYGKLAQVWPDAILLLRRNVKDHPAAKSLFGAGGIDVALILVEAIEEIVELREVVQDGR